MSLRPSLRVLGILVLLLSLAMGLVLLWNLYELYFIRNEKNIISFYANALAFFVGVSFSSFLIFIGKKNYESLGKRESFFIVSFSWILGAGVGALPFYFWAILSGQTQHEFYQYINCYFETVSGLTTTGASILSNIPEVPRALLLWRALVQWIGGLGIVVLFVAVMPLIAVANKKIFRAETSDIGRNQDTPSLKDMAQVLWLIYLFFTITQIFLMRLTDSDLSWFTCVTFAFSTTATAGFSIFNESAGTLKSSTQMVLILFMFLSGINYALFYGVLKGKWKNFLENTEFRVYLFTLFFVSCVMALALKDTSYGSMTGTVVSDPSYFRVALDSIFQAVSLHTTTGFSTANSNNWPEFAKYLLILMMFVGGCSGSTGGGIKVVRFIALFKLLVIELERAFRPNVVRPCTVGEEPLSSHQKHSILIHLHIVFALIAGGTFFLFFLEGGELDLVTAFTASLASINNIGPGFSLVGVTENYGFFSASSKALLSFLMVVGRLEVFTVLALFSRRFWQF